MFFPMNLAFVSLITFSNVKLSLAGSLAFTKTESEQKTNIRAMYFFGIVNLR
jgi:hypothetical protein